MRGTTIHISGVGRTSSKNKFDNGFFKLFNDSDDTVMIHNDLEVTDTPNEKRDKKLTHKISVISGASQQSVDFETAITETGFGKFNYLLILLAFPAACSTYFDTSVVSLVLPAASCDLKLDDLSKGFLNGAIYAGMVCGAFVWGFLSDTFGRQRLLVIGYFLDTICNICASFSRTVIQLIIFKFMSGLIICGPFSIFMAYLSEMFNGKYRDRMIMNVGIFISLGGIIQPTLAWLIIPLKIHWSFFNGTLEANSWRIFMLISTLPSLISGILTSFCVESPKFLMAKGRKEEALKVFRTIYSINTGMPRSSYPVTRLSDEDNQATIPDEGHHDRSSKIGHILYKFWRQLTALFRPPYAKKALVVFSIQFGALMSLNNLRLWLPLLFHRINKGAQKLMDASICDVIELHASGSTEVKNQSCATVDSEVYTHMICVSVVTNVVFVFCSLIVGKIGKKRLLICAYLVGATSSYIFVWVHVDLALPMASIFLSAMQASTIGLLGVAVELFPTNLRAMAVSLTMMFGRFGVLIGSLSMPLLMNLNCWAPFTGVGAISLCCAAALFILLRKPRTAT